MDALTIAFDFCVERESLRLRAYRDIAGKPTIGYGRTQDVKMGDVTTQEAEEKSLRTRLEGYEEDILSATTHAPSAHELAALLSLADNVGVQEVVDSTVIRLFNAGNRMGASKAFLLFDKYHDVNGVKKQSPGLLARRQLEAALFLTPDDQGEIAGQADAPTAHPYDPAPSVPSTAQSTPSHESLDQWLSGGLASTGLGLAGQAMSSGALVFGMFIGAVAVGLAIYFFIRARNRKNGVT